MRPLIVVTSCARDKAAGCHQAIRETWGKESPVEYRFILGQGNTAASDELVFDVPDDYAHVSFKTRASHAWAAAFGYSHVMQAFTDTYLNLRAMLKSDFANYDYTGCFRGKFSSDADFQKPDTKGRYAYASGGMGYWTSRRACVALAESEIGIGNWIDDPALMAWAEDLWVGSALGRKGIYGHHDGRYCLEGQWYLDAIMQKRICPDEVFSLHIGRGTGVYNPQWMHDAHNIVRNARYQAF